MQREKIKITVAVAFALSVLAAYSIWSYLREEHRLIAQIDEALYAAAAAVPFVLENDFHDRAVGARSIDTKEDRRNIENLSGLNNRLGTKFLYTVIEDQNGTYRLSSSSALREEFEKGTEVRYYTEYSDIPVMLKEYFENAGATFSERNETYHPLYIPIFSDRWGTYRSLFLPMRSPDGHRYAVGADIDISHVKALLRQNTLETLLEFFLFLLAIFPIIYAYISMLQRKDREFRQVHKLYLDYSKRSITDSLTHLYNRYKLDAELEMAYYMYRNEGKPFALVMLDIDHFKTINDRYGHPVGDTVLRHVAEILLDSTRATDTVARWGGEEFMILCHNTNTEGAHHIAEKIRLAIEQFVIERTDHISASFGVIGSAPGLTLQQLLQEVDAALYEAKRMGRNRTVRANAN